MTDEPILPPDDDAETLAAELALGLLEGEERAEAARRVLAEPDFARAVERWRAHFGVLVAEIAHAEPPPGLLARLESAIAPRAVPQPPVANDNRRLRFWQGAAGLSGLAAAALVGVLLMQPPPHPPVVVTRAAPALIASIERDDKAGPIAAAYYPDRAELRLAASTLTDQQHSAELWLIAADGVPHSLGVLPPGAARIVTVDPANARRFVSGSKLVVTREQHGGSPDGTPKGPAIAAGALLAV
jgi:anti-sigma-K factor RskA